MLLSLWRLLSPSVNRLYHICVYVNKNVIKEVIMNTILIRIRKIITQTGLSDTGFAESIGIRQSTLSNMFMRESDPKAEVLQKIREKYNINSEWLLTGEGAMFISEETLPAASGSSIPLLSQKVSCGSGVNWESEQNIVEYLDIQNLVPALKNRQLYGFRVSGTSMIGAGIKNNDIVIFSSEQNYVYNDGVYVFSLDGDVYCKRLEFDPIANRIKIYSVRVADIEKAELLTTLTSTDTTFTERFQLFGKVELWIHKDDN